MKNNIIKCSICNKFFNEKSYNLHLKSSDNTHLKLYNKTQKAKSPIKYTKEEKQNINKKFLKNLEQQLIQEENHSSYIPSVKKIEKTKEEIKKEFIEKLNKEIEKDKIYYKHIPYKSQKDIYKEQNKKIKNDYLQKMDLEIEKYEKEKDKSPNKENKTKIIENSGKYSNIENLINDDLKNQKDILLVVCPNCGRKFFENRINFHKSVCKGETINLKKN